MLIKILLVISTCALLYGCFIVIRGWSAFGSRPAEQSIERFKQSNHYDPIRHIFLNRIPTVLDEMRKRTFTVSAILKFLFGGSKERSPSSKLPDMQPDFVKLAEPHQDIKVMWFGHSSLLLNVDGNLILYDPVFSDFVGPLGTMLKRFQDTVVDLSKLPPIDYIVQSHDHYDHLDMKTIQFFIGKKTKFIVPLGVGDHLRGWGVPESQIRELDWWQNAKFDSIEFVSTPSQHFSGRGLIHQNESLWGSWVFRTNQHRIFFSGDTGYDIHFKEIGKKFGPFDIAFMETGQYNEAWHEVHLLPDEQIQAFQDLSAKRYFPIHWGMFNLAMHAWYEPIENLLERAEKNRIPVLTPQMGELVIVNNEYKGAYWWRSLIPKP